MTRRVPVVMPDLDLPGQSASVSLWHRACGKGLDAGDPLIEIIAGDVVIDIPAPATGVLAEKRVADDDQVVAGQVLGIIVLGMIEQGKAE